MIPSYIFHSLKILVDLGAIFSKTFDPFFVKFQIFIDKYNRIELKYLRNIGDDGVEKVGVLRDQKKPLFFSELNFRNFSIRIIYNKHRIRVLLGDLDMTNLHKLNPKSGEIKRQDSMEVFEVGVQGKSPKV